MDLLFTLLAKSPHFHTLLKNDPQQTIDSFVSSTPPSKAPLSQTSLNSSNATQLSIESGEHVLGELFSAWHKADFAICHKKVQWLLLWAKQFKDNKALAVLYLIRGSLYSSAGRYLDAKRDFARIACSSGLEDDYGKTILSYKIAWLYILEDRLDIAQRILDNSPKATNPIVKAHLSMLIAIISYQEADEVGAEGLFIQANDHFEGQGNSAAFASIQLYLSMLYMNSGDEKRHYDYLRRGLMELEKNGLTYITYWWHPKICGHLFGKAIELDFNPQHVKKILANHKSTQNQRGIGHRTRSPKVGAKRSHSVTYPKPDRASQRQKAEETLSNLFTTGVLDPRNVSALAARIPHGTRGQHINPTIVAVFGLQIQNISNAEIANTLLITENTVSAYITKIYNAFDLKHTDFPNRKLRKSQLIEQGKEEGYILALPVT